MNTYWVEYSYIYEIWVEIDEDRGWDLESDCDSGRFKCLKKDLEKEVRKKVEKDLEYEKYRNLKISIYDYYITTDTEN